MIKTLMATTRELDDQNLAVAEILEQLQPDTSFLKNSLAIVACHYEFVENGIIKTLGEKLPYPLVGTISIPCAAGEDSDLIMLSVMVITSDVTHFKTVLTDPVLDDPAAQLKKAYSNAAASEDKKPAAIFFYGPFSPLHTIGDTYVHALTEASGNVPCFGTLSIDGSLHSEKGYVIHNGASYLNRCCMVLAYDMAPKFYFANISPSKIISKPAVITKCDGNALIEVNNDSVQAYLTGLGIWEESKEAFSMLTLPFVVDYKDNSAPVTKTLTHLSAEGHAMFASELPQGGSIQIATNEEKDVLSTTEAILNIIMDENKNAAGMLVYSCISRYITLGKDALVEMNLVKQKTAGHIPYLMASAGGEICPMITSDNALVECHEPHTSRDIRFVNRYHNNTIVFCVF
ncbi:MAG: FIST C-terminal domain-containing protein [Defluviitaleaceae bacterium]|nr:FIST C-terminal domain-containing protein [Defluviitaleaceae bacterium]